MPSFKIRPITVGARNSPLSRAQVAEVLEEIRAFEPHVHFEPIFVDTIGDKDRKTSLRDLGKTDFFTREIDELVLRGICQIGIHSAKDLPDPLPKGLKLIALTKGVDPSDSLVFKEGYTLKSIPLHASIGTSSIRREEALALLRMDLRPFDIRGTIQERLAKLLEKDVYGVIVAEAALIRLKLTHLPRMQLPGETTPLQGRLAIIAREEDLEMQTFFKTMSLQKDCCHLY